MTDLAIEGMTCQHCQRAVKNALEAIDGVVSVEVDLDRGSARIAGTADVAAMIRAVEDEGYRASPSDG
jgi:copper chaperone